MMTDAICITLFYLFLLSNQQSEYLSANAAAHSWATGRALLKVKRRHKVGKLFLNLIFLNIF